MVIWFWLTIKNWELNYGGYNYQYISRKKNKLTNQSLALPSSIRSWTFRWDQLLTENKQVKRDSGNINCFSLYNFYSFKDILTEYIIFVVATIYCSAACHASISLLTNKEQSKYVCDQVSLSLQEQSRISFITSWRSKLRLFSHPRPRICNLQLLRIV